MTPVSLAAMDEIQHACFMAPIAAVRDFVEAFWSHDEADLDAAPEHEVRSFAADIIIDGLADGMVPDCATAIAMVRGES